MGFNISGIAINKNYKNNFEQLEKELGWKLIKHGELDFESASSNWKEDEFCDVYFTKNGTLLFISMDRCETNFCLQHNNVLTFVLSETSMAFKVGYTEKGVEKRKIVEVDDIRMVDKGEVLQAEMNTEDTSEIIWNLIEEIIGKRFWDIEFDDKALRYMFR